MMDKRRTDTKERLAMYVYRMLKKNHPLELTSDKIAKGFGLRKPSLFYHFKTTDEIILSGFKMAALKGDVKLLEKLKAQILNSRLDGLFNFKKGGYKL